MAPVATEPTASQARTPSKPEHPYYQVAVEDDPKDPYPYKQYRVCNHISRSRYRRPCCHLTLFHHNFQPRYPDLKWPKLEPFDIKDRGLRADPSKKNLLSAASEVITLNPTIGTEIHGVDLRTLTEAQKDELFVVLRADLSIQVTHNQLRIGPCWWPNEESFVSVVISDCDGNVCLLVWG